MLSPADSRPTRKVTSARDGYPALLRANRPSLLILALAMVLTAGSRAQVLDGRQVNLTYYHPDRTSVWTVGQAVFDGVAPTTFGPVITQFFVTITDRNIRVTFNGPFVWTSGLPFNGWVLTVSGDPITNVTVNPETNISGFDLSFDSGQVILEWDGVSGGSSSVLSLDVEGATDTDLTVTDVRPIQAVFDFPVFDPRLVKGKPTAVLVDIALEGSLSSDVIVEVEVGDSTCRASVPKEQFEVLSRSATVTVSACSPALEPTEFTMDIMAEVNPDRVIDESDFTNNTKLRRVDVRGTKALNLAYVGIEGCRGGGCGYGPLQEFLLDVINGSAFVDATFPVPVVNWSTTGGLIGSPSREPRFFLNPISGRLELSRWDQGVVEDLVTVHTVGFLTNPQAIRSIGIVPDGYFSYHSAPDGVGAGQTPGEAGLVTEGYWTSTAHELAHTFGFQHDSDDVLTQGGYWVAAMRPIPTRDSFMPAGNPQFRRLDRDWIGRSLYFALMDSRFLRTIADPSLLLVAAVPNRDGGLEMYPSYIQNAGVPSQTGEGDYVVQLLDVNGQPVVEHRLPFVATDSGPLLAKVPFPDKAVSLVIRRAEQILVRSVVGATVLADAVGTIPEAGFERNSSQRRTALLNKIASLELQLQTGATRGAAQRLRQDIRRSLENWLVDDYRVESPIQYTKANIIALVDELIRRLEN